MTLNVTRKKLLLSAVIFLLLAIAAAGINFKPEKSAPAEKALIQKKKSRPAVRKTAPTASRAGRVDTKTPDVVPAEREEAYKNDTPEKARMRASLEEDIKALTEEKEKAEKELSVMISSFDDALNNSQLPPEEMQTKQAEMEAIKEALMSTYNENISSLDSSLQDKLQQYREVTQD